MKLIDFNNHPGFNSLREKMDALLLDIGFDPEWERIKVQLEEIGIDVEISEIDIAWDSTFEYRGQKVIVYIRDQYKHIIDDKGAYKFHISHCSTYEHMLKKNRQARYVVTTRKDGLFLVNIINNNAIIENKIESKLDVCKNCLSKLGFSKNTTFDILNFFEKNANTMRRTPNHTEITAPINGLYPDNWAELSNKIRELKKWKCENIKCTFKHLNFSEIALRKFLHVHHIDGNKSNNFKSNLMVLCIHCHAEQPDHQHMKSLPDFKRLQKLKYNL